MTALAPIHTSGNDDAVDPQNVTSCQVTLKVLKSEPRLVVAPVL